MTDLYDKIGRAFFLCQTSTPSADKVADSVSSEAGPISCKFYKPALWPDFLVSAFSGFDTCSESKGKNKVWSIETYGLASTLKRVMTTLSMRRILGLSKNNVCISKSDIWLLGICYKVAQYDSTDPTQSEGFASFVEDFSSRILATYRKGFPLIPDTKYSSDVNWGCMLRSSQMLFAQALLFHLFGRFWRRTVDRPLEQNYIKILHLFGDSESSPYSIHNLLQAGRTYGLSPGAWVGPYAICRTWETLVRCKRKESTHENLTSAINVYVVSGDGDGQRGGAPVVCIEDVTEFSEGQADWVPTVLMVPLVLGLHKLNPRYLPLLGATFCFPQSLGILGGKPGVSTYIIGIQDDEAFYLDPHEVQQVVDINADNLDADTSSYHSNTVRHFPLESLDPSLAIGFYCNDRSDFDDFCLRASELAEQSSGAPLFTVTKTRNSPCFVGQCNHVGDDSGVFEPDSFETAPLREETQEDEWQLL